MTPTGLVPRAILVMMCPSVEIFVMYNTSKVKKDSQHDIDLDLDLFGPFKPNVYFRSSYSIVEEGLANLYNCLGLSITKKIEKR